MAKIKIEIDYKMNKEIFADLNNVVDEWDFKTVEKMKMSEDIVKCFKNRVTISKQEYKKLLRDKELDKRFANEKV